MVSDFMILVLVAIGLSVMTQLINKLLINEKFVEKSREKIKNMQKEIKNLEPKSKEFRKNQEEIIDLNFKLMKQQFKPMIFTFLPYILAFYFLGSMFAFMPMAVGSQINVHVSGSGIIESECLGLNETFQNKEIFNVEIQSNDCEIIVNDNEVELNLIGKQEEVTASVGDVNIKLEPEKRIFLNLPFNIPFIGNELGWLGTFIMFSFASSLILNKSLKGVYLRKWE